MSLLEEMKEKRERGTSVADEELKDVVTKICEAFKEWQERDIDRKCFKMYAIWNANILELETAEEGKTTKVTETIQSKKKQMIMIDELEKKLEEEGVKVNRNDMTRSKSGEISFTANVVE